MSRIAQWMKCAEAYIRHFSQGSQDLAGVVTMDLKVEMTA
jgi:hypothetical protein